MEALKMKAMCEVGEYLQRKLAQELSNGYYVVPFPADWTFDFLNDCNRAVTIIAHALKNPGG